MKCPGESFIALTQVGHDYVLVVGSLKKTSDMFNGLAPLVAILFALRAECSLDDGSQLKASKHKGEGFRLFGFQHTTAVDGKVVRRISDVARLGLSFEAN